MEQDAVGDDGGLLKLLNDSDERPRSAVNSVVLDYYKKFGRKRDLEQYFSLSTAQSDIRDPRSLFWRRMKEQSDTSDSGDKKSEESSNEICRISIKCSIPERSEVDKGDSQSNNDSESPPIITDALPMPSPSADESMDDDHSQKSGDGTLDTSVNKPLSPTSSITSQRKLEWDSLADVGYGNESDRKTSASSLSTLEREVLAQKQQYTLGYKQNSDLGLPTAHSTPVDPNDDKSKGKKGQGKKTISISRKDVDFVEVSVPRSVENAQPINVNLTKQFSVNLQQDGGFTVDNVKKDVTISPEKNTAGAPLQASAKIDREIQTSLPRSKDQNSVDCVQEASTSAQKTPILISLNALRWKQRRKKMRNPRTKVRTKKKIVSKTMSIHEKDKSGEQVSEAESFEYMPGHIYNQNQLQQDPNTPRNNNNVGNKSSLESSAVHTTDSSKESKYSFSKDLDKTINVLKLALKEKYDSKLKKKLVTEIINRLLKSNFGDGEQTPDFLSVLSLASRKTPTTSTSEADNTDSKEVHSKPKKSILRVNKFDANYVASNSQSAPNLTSVVNSDKRVEPSLSKLTSSTTTETDLSNNSAKDVTSSDTVFARTSSEELYKKYIDALKREEAYKQHLRDKQLFLRQKLVRSETAAKVPIQVRANNKLQELVKDLTRNNYDDGSGDASKLEGGSSSNFDINGQRVSRKHRSHSVFTLSSGNSDIQHRTCLKNKLQDEINSPRTGPSNQSGNAVNRPVVTDSSVQVNLHEEPMSHNAPMCTFTEEAKYVCLCTEKTIHCPLNPDEVMVYKCPIAKTKTSTIHQPTCNVKSTSSSIEDDANNKFCPKKQRTIMECTRCLQTKISVPPNISDPSVSDVNIIKSADCVKLINELYRKVSQSTSECQCSREKEDSHSNTCKSSKDYIRQHKDDQDNLMEDDGNELAPLVDQQMAEQNIAQPCVGCQKITTNQPESASDNIVIPIQGTNMMLKVSIGGKSMKIQDEQMPKETLDRRNIQDKEVVTDTIRTSLKGTSILDECSKFVQTENPAHINKDTNIGPPRESTISRNSERERRSMSTKNAHDFTGDTSKSNSNTYPKKVHISDKKPFLRSNTDTGSLAANSAIHTDTIFKDKKTQPCFHAEMGQDLSPRKHSKYEAEHAKQATPSVPGTSGSSNYGSGNKSQNSKQNKNKHSAELKETDGYETVTEEEKPRDLILDVIKDITQRYSKKDTDKRRKKKCFKEIMTALSYLLDTDDSGDGDQEYSKKSQSSKGSRSLQSEFVANPLLNEAESSKSASCQKSSNSPRLARKSKKFINPQSSTRDTSERNMKAESWDRESTQNRCCNKADGENSEMVSSESKPAVPKSTCEKGCGCDGSTDCEDCMRHPSAKTGTCSSGIESSRSEKNRTKSALNRETLLRTTDLETDSSGKVSRGFEKQEAENVTGPCEKKSVPIRYESGCNLRNKDKSTCDISCGCDGSADCKDCVERHSPRYRVCRSGEESSRPIYQEAKCGSPKSTKNTCDETVPQTFQTGSGSRCKDFAKSEKHRRPESPNNKKLTCDKSCGCDGTNECGDCDRHSPKYGIDKCTIESARSKKQGSPCSPKKTKTTCRKSCDCDGSEECRNCMSLNSPYGIDKSIKDSARSKKQEVRCASPNKTKITRDKCCGCKGSEECQSCMRPNSPKYGTDRINKLCTRTKKQERSVSPKITKAFACDKCCDCEDLEKYQECVPPNSTKYVIDRCSKEPARPEKQASRCNSPQKTKTTCDKCCDCDDLGKCKDCTEPHSPKLKSGRCGMEPMKSTKQAKSKCDKCCGCDGPFESEECVEPQPKYATCRDRSNSPNRVKRTCDKGCGPDNNLQDKENFNFKKQDVRCNSSKKFVNRCVQSTVKRVKSLYSHSNDSSEIASSDQPCCSTDSPTVKLVNKIKKECDRYQKRCKCCKGCQASSSSAVSCEHCKRHYRWHKCRCHRTRSTEKKKKCVAYNLIVQTSDSIISEDIVIDRCRPLQNVVVKVPKLKQENIPFKEACAKIEQRMPFYSNRFEPKEPKGRSQSWPNECGISSTDDVKMANQCTVREYLEKNRPDFVDRCATRQNCIRMISESRSRERSQLREQMVGLGTLQSLNDEELMYLAKELGFGRRRPLQHKIISEREMKKHSEKIYKSLPEVRQKKEDVKKENIRKTNLLMANIFKKNLQKKTLSGDVNISNYNQVVKI